MDEIREGTLNSGAEPDSDAQNSSDGEGAVTAEAVFEASERVFSTSQTVFAWISWLAGYLLCRLYPIASSPLGGFLFVLGLLVATMIILKKQGAAFTKMSVLAIATATVLSLALILSSNEMLHMVSFAFSLATLGYFVYSSTGNALKNGFSDLILVDFFKALVVLPFCSFGQMFKALFYGRASSGGKTFGKIMLGVCIALIPTITVIVLLSYDDGFTEILGNIFAFNFLDVLSHAFSIGLGVPIGMYIFGLFLSSSDGDKAEYIDAETMGKISLEMKRLPTVTGVAASAPLLFIYIVFFISQWRYYISGFTGVLPDDQSYANYAREGFFQLCAVSVINLLAIIVLSAFMRRNVDGRSLVLKLLSVVFSVFTLILISTAIAKMVMYIDCYGLTPKRVYASWFMVLLALVFVIITVKQFVEKFKAIIACVGVSVVMLAVLSLSNVDGIIARHNVDRYLDGSLKTVDVGALYDLGDSATPELVRLANELDERLGTDISISLKQEKDTDYSGDSERLVYCDVTDYLKRSASRFELENNGIFSYTLQKYRAEKALKSIGALDCSRAR